VLFLAALYSHKNCLIFAWEYIDLAKLLLEQLHFSSEENHTSNTVVLPEHTYDTQRPLIPDIATWVKVYSAYMLVLTSHHLSSTPELIVQQFEYPSRPVEQVRLLRFWPDQFLGVAIY